MSMSDGEKWVCVGSARNVGEAALLRHALAAHGIDLHTRGEHLPAIAGELPMPEARIEIWVHAEDAERATAIIDEVSRESGVASPGSAAQRAGAAEKAAAAPGGTLRGGAGDIPGWPVGAHSRGARVGGAGVSIVTIAAAVRKRGRPGVRERGRAGVGDPR